MTIQQAYELAVAHLQAGRPKDADELLRQILVRQPDHADALHLAGVVSHRGGRSPRAVEFIRRAILLNPNVADYYNNLGLIVAGQGALEEGIDALRKAIELRPDFARAHNNLGTLFSERRQWDEAIASFRRAIAIEPGYAEAESNLASALRETGELDQAIAGYQRASELRGDPRIASNLLYLLHFHPDYGPREIGDAHSEWNRTFAAPLADAARTHANDRSPERRLRVGYVSPDFRQHPVGRFIAPLLENHDRGKFEVYCYSDVGWPDAMTQRLQLSTDVWRDTAGTSDEQLAATIREDGIDVLIDLAMHMENNRLLVFARKPAPVQVTYLAYCSTTGLEAIDYRLSDKYLDPTSTPSTSSGQAGSGREPDDDESAYSEKTVRLRSYWCYEAPAEAEGIAPQPSSAAGRVTFGCLNNFSKVTGPTLTAWARILRSVNGSRIVIHSGEGGHRQRVREEFARAGIESGRVEFVGRMPADAYFERHNAIDVSLDPFPYPGGTTSCDALWMGSPVVSLAGRTAVSRAGVSILSAIGLPDLVAGSVDEYVKIASRLAADASRRAELRGTLRERMRGSVLMDSVGFARDFETVVREMWRRWCETKA